jgi:hypothetical protein
MKWENIQYRDFHDVPRIFIFQWEGKTYLANCPFSHELDEYESTYSLFELPPLTTLSLDGPWEGLRGRALRKIGEVAVVDVIFDPTRRRQVDTDVFRKMLEPRKPVVEE